MTRSLTALTAALMLATPSMALAASKTYDLGPFTAVDISSGINAVVTVGGDQSVTAESADQPGLDELMLEVRDGTLHAWTDWNLFDLLDFGGTRQITITIAVPELTGANASAGADVEVTGIAGDAVTLNSSAGADLDVRGAAGLRYEINASAGADLTVAGDCEEARVNVSAGADLNASRLTCESVDVNASAGASADVYASAGINADSSSGASINVYGSPAQVEQNASSGGDVDFRD